MMIKIGVAYYPEQWPRERWDDDARAMARFGADLVRIGEFAWSRLEPRRERFEMDWMEEAVDTMTAHGLKVILCTPTAAPPPWLFSRHTSLLPQRADGRMWYYGSSRHVCLNNPAYEKYVRRIVTELARRFAPHPGIDAWQVDNEIGSGRSGVCLCDECEQAFRMWLKRRYGTIDRLNKSWGTSFWSQEFVDWHEVPEPRDTPGSPHPSLALDYRRFVSARIRAFVKQQKDIISVYAAPGQPITANEPWPQDHINAFALSEVQDVISVVNTACHAAPPEQTAMSLDFARSLHRKPFWVMQQPTGAAPASGACTPRPAPGQLRLWTYQAAVHGADMVCFFRWRTAPAGQEMYHDGILDADGTPGRRYDELQQTVAELRSRSVAWRGRAPRSRVAICLDYESLWALRSSPLGSRPDSHRHIVQLYRALRRHGQTVDFVAPQGLLGGYDLVLTPMPFAASSRTAGSLEAYAGNGGTLLITAPAGFCTGMATAGSSRPPGPLAPLLGLEITEYDHVPHDGNRLVFENGDTCPAEGLACILDLTTARALATYEKGYYHGSPALTVSETDGGRAMFLGVSVPDHGIDRVLDLAMNLAGMTPPPWECDDDRIEMIEWESEEESVRNVFVLNHADTPRVVRFRQGWEARELLTGQDTGAGLRLDAFQSALVELRCAASA